MLTIQCVLIWSDIFWEAVNDIKKIFFIYFEVSPYITRFGGLWKCKLILCKANSARDMNYCPYSSTLWYGYIWRICIFFENKFISLELFDFEKNALWFQKSPNLTILGTTSNWIRFPFFIIYSLSKNVTSYQDTLYVIHGQKSVKIVGIKCNLCNEMF